MARSASLVIMSSPECTGNETDSVRRTVLHIVQAMEDLALAERIERRLRATGYGALREIEVTIHDGNVILGGRVPSYYLKLIAQAIARSVIRGRYRLRNDLGVGQLS